jgi:ketosteroid isomerase-like protein
MKISEWVRQLFTTIDKIDARAFAGYLSEDGVFRFANQPEARGRAAVEAAVAGFFASLAGLKHELVNEWSAPDSVVVEGRVTYTRKDGTSVTLPFVDVFERSGTVISLYKIYMDATPLFAPAA